MSDQATIWRWREAFQHDLAARMDWTVAPFERGEPHTRRDAERRGGHRAARAWRRGRASRSCSTRPAAATRDGHALTLPLVPLPGGRVRRRACAWRRVAIAGADSPRATVTPTAACRPLWLPTGPPCATGVAHVILAVTDDGTPSLTSYRRVVLTVRAGR